MNKIQNILIIFLGLIVGALAVYSTTLSHRIKNILDQDPTTVHITDTIANWEYDTLYFTHYIKDTLALTDTAIIYDTITDTKFVEVQVPIYETHFDTSIYYSNFSCFDDSLIVGISQTVRGYKVELVNTILDVKGTLTPVQPQPQKWYNNLGVGVGLMYGTSGFGIGVGLMYKL